jgi:transcriptional regulator with XRE-family HTH domain
MAVGELLRKARRRLGKSQAEIAAQVGVTQPRIAQIESGDNIGAQLIAPLAKAYGVSPLDLLPPKKSKKAKGAA